MISTYKNLMDEYSANDIILPSYDPISLGSSFTVDFTLHAIIKYLRGVKVFVTKRNVDDIRPMLQAKHFKNMVGRLSNTASAYTEYRWKYVYLHQVVIKC